MGLIGAVIVGLWTASGQVRGQATEKRPAKTGAVRPPTVGERPPKEVTLAGRVVSLHQYMTGRDSPDTAKAMADGIRAGGAAALETPSGLVIVGQGNTSAIRVLLPLAYQQVEAHGKLYEKGGVKFLDLDTVHAAEAEADDEEEEEEEGDE